MTAQYIPLILIGVFLNAIAQLLLKQGMRLVDQFDFTLSNVIPVGFSILKNPFVLGGLFCYVVSVGVWLMALSRVDVSYAYPLLSVGYIFTAVAAYFFLGEDLSLLRVAGIFIIIIGVWCVAQS